MSKRLEEIVEIMIAASIAEDADDERMKSEIANDLLYGHENHVDWLIEQVGLMQHFAKKNAELNVFLSKYSEPKHLGKNVIDVAMDIIAKQTERVQDLEDIIYQDERQAVLEGLYEQNKRYREALERLLKESRNYEKNTNLISFLEEALEERK